MNVRHHLVVLELRLDLKMTDREHPVMKLESVHKRNISLGSPKLQEHRFMVFAKSHNYQFMIFR